MQMFEAEDEVDWFALAQRWIQTFQFEFCVNDSETGPGLGHLC